MFTDIGDLSSEGTKVSTLEKQKIKEKAEEKDGLKGGGEGASVEVKKEEENKDGAEVKPGKEKLNITESCADSKPPGDKYSPKVRLKNIFCYSALRILLSLFIPL